MIVVPLPVTGTFAAWRAAARGLLAQGIAPADLDWRCGAASPGLFDQVAPEVAAGASMFHVPASFVDLARDVICHRDPMRFARLYALLWRLRARPQLMGDTADPALRALRDMARSVGRDRHKMHAFLRFHEVPSTGPRRAFAAWYEPDHLIVESVVPFFRNRFADMDWTILTPDARADFRDSTVTLGPGAPRPPLPDDQTAALWTTYYSHIFNPARVNPSVMRSHMPTRFWANMPEAQAIPGLIAGAEAQLRQMAASGAVPSRRPDPEATEPAVQSLTELQARIRDCRRCDLCRAATQAVCGTGAAQAALMVVGEQPGDAEDRRGQPFVGPAGAVLDQALAAEGLDRGAVWLTNAVKHFKFTPRGKQRLHQNPTRGEIQHCRWWLDEERRLIAPRVTLALGNSAVWALTGRAGQIAARRGQVETARDGGTIILSWHPAAILRQPDPVQAQEMRQALRRDLALAWRLSMTPGDQAASAAAAGANGLI